MAEMTTEKQAKMQQVRRERAETNKQRRQEERIQIGRWVIFPFDAENWVLTRLGEEDDESEYRYYPTVHWALKALTYQYVGDAAKKGIQGILSALKVVEEKIDSLRGEGV